MPTLLRITLIAFSLALGIGVALALALHKPALAAKKKAAEPPAAATAPPAAATAAPPTPVIAPYRDPVAARFSELHDSIAEIAQIEQSNQRRQASMMRAFTALQDQLAEQAQDQAQPQPVPPAAAPPAVPPAAAPPAVLDPLNPPDAAPPPAPGLGDPLIRSTVRRLEGDDKLDVNAQNSDIRAVLENLSQMAGLNIMASR